MRKILRNIHLWLGLTAGALLIVIGLTGSAIVFYKPIEEWIYSDIMLIEKRDSAPISLADALRAAVNKYPDDTVLGVMPPRHENAAYIAYRFIKTDGGGYSYRFVPINPYTSEILGELEFGKTVMTFIYRLHYNLTIGEWGSVIVGFVGIFFLVSLFSGLSLWWPKAGKWKQALWFKKGASSHRRNFDIHRVFGFYPLIILVVVAFSGIYMEFPKQVKWITSNLLDIEEEDEFHFDKPLEAGPPQLSYEQVIEIAANIFPGARITDFDKPHDASHPFTVSFADPGQPMKSYGYNVVSIHPYSGEVMHVRKWDRTMPGNIFLAWQFPLHNGEAFGLAGRWIIFFSGLLPLVLYVTGILMWLKRRKGGKTARISS